jgi:hypothetical protein
MSTAGDKEIVAIVAGADLTAAQYKIIAVAGTIAATNAVALGVLQNKPNTGENASIAYCGHMKAYVGGAVAAGAQLVVTTSGYLITNATSVSGIVGKALTAASSGALCEFVGDFATVRDSYSIGII